LMRTPAAGRCPNYQVKAIRAVARFLYLLFLLGVRCPNLFFCTDVARASPSRNGKVNRPYPLRGKCSELRCCGAPGENGLIAVALYAERYQPVRPPRLSDRCTTVRHFARPTQWRGLDRQWKNFENRRLR